jgi:hypothetical protein
MERGDRRPSSSGGISEEREKVVKMNNIMPILFTCHVKLYFRLWNKK